PARGELGWHDAAARLEGPVVADVAEHFALRWREVTGEALVAPAHGPAAAGGLDVQLVRTVPEGISDAQPHGDFRHRESYVGALRQRGPGAQPVYVHAKIGIVDDAWLTLGSSNLNEHSLFNDTEVNVVVRDPALVRQTRLRLCAEYLEHDPAELEGDPTEIVD